MESKQIVESIMKTFNSRLLKESLSDGKLFIDYCEYFEANKDYTVMLFGVINADYKDTDDDSVGLYSRKYYNVETVIFHLDIIDSIGVNLPCNRTEVEKLLQESLNEYFTN